jgi:hypothetical protein
VYINVFLRINSVNFLVRRQFMVFVIVALFSARYARCFYIKCRLSLVFHIGHAVVQALNNRPVSAEPPFRSPAISCEIYAGRSNCGSGFCQTLSVSSHQRSTLTFISRLLAPGGQKREVWETYLLHAEESFLRS